jgi:hypothetical protein
MPERGSEYALLQRKYQHENLIQEVASHRSRAREREHYVIASQRNGLEEQRGNLRNGLERLPPPMRTYYLDRINQLDARIDASKRKYPMFRGNYD